METEMLPGEYRDGTNPETARLGAELVAHRRRVTSRCRGPQCGNTIEGYTNRRFCSALCQRRDYRLREKMIGLDSNGVMPSVDEVHGDPEDWEIDVDHQDASASSD